MIHVCVCIWIPIIDKPLRRIECFVVVFHYYIIYLNFIFLYYYCQMDGYIVYMQQNSIKTSTITTPISVSYLFSRWKWANHAENNEVKLTRSKPNVILYGIDSGWKSISHRFVPSQFLFCLSLYTIMVSALTIDNVMAFTENKLLPHFSDEDVVYYYQLFSGAWEYWFLSLSLPLIQFHHSFTRSHKHWLWLYWI